MKTIALTAITVMALAVLLVTPVASQDASPSPVAIVPTGTPTPWEEFREFVLSEVFTDAESEDAESESTQTVAEMQANIAETLPKVEAIVARLQDITPEPCYAEVHTSVVEINLWLLDLMDDMEVVLENATTVWDILPLALLASTEAVGRWPIVEVPDDPDDNTIRMGGPQTDYKRVLTLATC